MRSPGGWLARDDRYLGARAPERGQSAERELASDGADVRFLQLDVTDQTQVDAVPSRPVACSPTAPQRPR